MELSFKEKFEKYELLMTPFFLMIILLIFYVYIPQIFPINNFNELFVVPSIIGNIIGLIITFLLDNKWRKVNLNTILDFLRVPTLILVLLACIATLLISTDPYTSFTILGLGLGAMFTIICYSSLLTYYRAFFKNNTYN